MRRLAEKESLRRKRLRRKGRPLPPSPPSLEKNPLSLSLKKKKTKLTWLRYQKSSTGLPLTRTSLREPFGRSSGLRTGTQLVEEASASEEEGVAAAAAIVVVVAGKRLRLRLIFSFFLKKVSKNERSAPPLSNDFFSTGGVLFFLLSLSNPCPLLDR